jgi:hypothetical protein
VSNTSGGSMRDRFNPEEENQAKSERKMEVKEIFYLNEPRPSNTDQILELAKRG